MNLFTALHVFFYKLTGGRIGGRFRGAPVLLLRTVGRKSGKGRTTPLLYAQDGSSWIIVASNGGKPKDPSWLSNLRKNPNATFQIKNRKQNARARIATLEERTRLWPIMTKIYPSYDDYQKKTEREIPLVVLESPSP